MKTRKFLVKQLVNEVRIKSQDLRRDFKIDPSALKELSSLEKKVSPKLYYTLALMLQGFHKDLQLEMAEDMVVFAHELVAHTTKCYGADYVLDVCYGLIASELGLLNRSVINVLYNK
jgi:hypothetical protein